MRRAMTVALAMALGCSRPRHADPAASGQPTPVMAAATAAPGSVAAQALDASSSDASWSDAAASDAATLAPRPGFFEALPVAGHPDAWMSLPTGATGKRPVVVVIHGAGDRPDWQCGGWRRATSGFPFIVCPR